MKKRGLVLQRVVVTLLLLLSGAVQGQEMLGVITSTYSGSFAAGINPALLTGSRFYMDVNLVGGNVSFANNAIYFDKSNNTIGKAIHLDEGVFTGGTMKWDRTYTYYDNAEDKYFASDIKILGPSFMLQKGPHAYGLFYNLRSFHSGKNVPYEIPIILYEGMAFPPYYGVEFEDHPYSFTSMTWSEIGINYAYDFYERYNQRFTFGIALKALMGHEAMYVDMRHSNFIILNAYDVNFKNVDADIAFSLPMTYDNNPEPDLSPITRGTGVGVDLGFVYTKLKPSYVDEGDDRLCSHPYKDFIYKLGVSVLDLGGIAFTKDAQVHNFDNVNKLWIDFDSIHYKGVDYTMQVYSEGFYGDPDASLAANKVTVFTPATLSVQFDYHYQTSLYVSAIWMHPLNFGPRTLWRPAQLAVVPRYDSKFLGVSLPLSIMNYSEPRIGLAIRVYSLTVGTDRLGSYLGVKNLDGMDFYFTFRFNIRKGSCMNYQNDACYNADFSGRTKRR